MFLNVLLFNFFPQVFLLWLQLLIHCQDSSAVFLMPFIFLPDMFGKWGAGKEAGAAASLLPNNSIFPYRLKSCCEPTSCLGSKGCFSLSVMKWTAFHWWPSIHVAFQVTIPNLMRLGSWGIFAFSQPSPVWFGALLGQFPLYLNVVLAALIQCFLLLSFCFFGSFKWQLFHTQIHIALPDGEVGCWKLKASCFAKVERSLEMF